MPRRLRCHLPGTLLLLALAAPAAAAPRIVASIAPIHSLVAAVTRGVTRPELLVPGGQSPHTFALATSQARTLAHADAVFAAAPAVESFLRKPLRSLAAGARVVWMIDVAGVHRLPARRGGAWAQPDGDDTDAASVDPHLWLDPRNAAAFVSAAADALARIDPAHARDYRANAERARARLDRLDARIARALRPVTGVPFLVYHDAYHYLDARYRLDAVGSVVVDPGRPPGARRLAELRTRADDERIACLFTEPQFPPAIARTVVQGTGIRLASLDPLGADLAPGPSLYFGLMERLADDLRGCLVQGR